MSTKMDPPDGFDAWSEDCKKRFLELQKEWDARQALEDALTAAKDAADQKKKALDALAGPEADDEKELAALEAWEKGADQARKDLDQQLQTDLQREYQQWLAGGQRTDAQKEAKQKELIKRRDDALAKFDKERADKKKRRAELHKAIAARKKDLDAARKASADADAAVAKLEAQLKPLRSEDDMIVDWYALLRACGPKDPEAGKGSVEVTPEGDGPEREPTPWEKRLIDFLKEHPHFWRARVETREPAPFVGSSDDVLPFLADDQPCATPVGTTTGAVWYEGCVEYLWVQGTKPTLSPKTHSNPITKTIARVAGDVNAIWGACCVRFRAYLKVVKLADLGDLNKASGGVALVDDQVSAASLDKIDKSYADVIKKLQDHQDCAGFLVVDHIDDDDAGNGMAGFASGGGKAGIITIGSGGHDRIGTTAAHELGHALGGIDHVEGGTQHAHGDLMWGKGCDGYPERKRDLTYEHLTTSDCAKMKAATTATTDPCDHDHGT